jgi:hypothetical protein
MNPRMGILPEGTCGLPPGAAIECVLQILADGCGGHDGTKAAPSPGGNGGTRDVNVLGKCVGAATSDVFAQPVVVGASCPRCLRDSRCHPQRISCASKNLNDIKGAAFANKKLRMSSFAAPVFAPRVLVEALDRATELLGCGRAGGP